MTTDPRLEFDTSDRIRKALRVAKMDQKKLAAALGLTPGAVSVWVRGLGLPNLDTLHAVADTCGVPRDWLVYGPGRTPTPAEEAWMRQIATVADDTRQALADLEDALHEAGQRGPEAVQALADHLLDRLTAPRSPK